MNDLKLIKKETPFLIEGTLFSTTKNNKTLKMAYEYKDPERKPYSVTLSDGSKDEFIGYTFPEEGKDCYGFSLPKPFERVEALWFSSRMIYGKCNFVFFLDDEGNVYFDEESPLNKNAPIMRRGDTQLPVEGVWFIMFADEVHMNLYKKFYEGKINE